MKELLNNYIAVNMICVIALLVLAHLSWRNAFFIYKMKKQFILAAGITIMVIAAEMGSVIFESNIIGNRFFVFTTNVIGFALSPFIAVILANAFSVEKGMIKTLLTIPAWINLVFVISSPWTGLIFYFSDNNYLRGSWFGVYLAAHLCTYIVLVLESLKAMRHYQCHIKSTLIMLLVFTFSGTLVQITFPYMHTSWLCITFGLILYYAYFCELSETQDTLTGLLNRSVYQQYIKKLNQNASGSILVFDLDNFKQTNDLYGHPWGDSCLEMIGKIIKECFLHMGLCYRVGGDEFCVICRTTNEQDLEDALALFHRKIGEIRKSGCIPYELPMVSAGYAIFIGSGNEYAAAMREADAQMYDFKNKRKQNYE